ncbi:MAG: hypothetical protein QXO15_00975 [Nitrososphaerota archaeon]
MTYTTIDTVKAFARISHSDLGYPSDSEFNSFIENLIEYVKSIIDDYCGRQFTPPIPTAISFVATQICANILHTILQRKINPTIQTSEFAIKLVTPEAFTDELKIMLDHYRILNIQRG